MHSNFLLVSSNVPDYSVILNSVNQDTLPFLYSINTTHKEVLDFLSLHPSIKRIGFVFLNEPVVLFLENKPFFTTDDLSDDNNGIFSDNLSFCLNIIRTFNIDYFDFLSCDNSTNLSIIF
jgi:hypothetical protein